MATPLQTRVSFVFVAIFLLASGCSVGGSSLDGSDSSSAGSSGNSGDVSDDSSDDSSDDVSDGSSDEDVSGDSAWALLDLIPSSGLDGNGFVYVSDWDLAASQARIDPILRCTQDQIGRYVSELTIPDSGRPEALAAPSLARVLVGDEPATELGFTVCDIEAVAFGVQEPGNVTVFDVGDASSEIDSVLRADPIWGPDLEVRSTGESDYYFWSDEVFDPDRITPFRELGRGGQLAVSGDHVVRTVVESSIQESLTGRSVGEDPVVASVAEVLASENVHSAVLTREAPPLDTLFLGAPQDLREEAIAEAGEGLAGHSLLALGATHEDGANTLIVVIASPGALRAAENTERLEKILVEGRSLANDVSWDEIFALQSIETVDDLTIARVRSASEGPRVFAAAFNSLHSYDTLFFTTSDE